MDARHNQVFGFATRPSQKPSIPTAYAGGAPDPTHEIFADYRLVDAVLLPVKQVVKRKPKGASDWTVFQTLTYTSVTFNGVDPRSLHATASRA